jgi:hypothetical protein
VFLMTVEELKDKDRRALISIDLDGSDLRTHVVSENATQFAISPDGKWLAFCERFNAFIAPFVPDRPRDRPRPQERLPARRARLARRGREPAVVGRFDDAALVARTGALHARPERGLRVPSPARPRSSRRRRRAAATSPFDADQDRPAGALAFTNARLVTMKGDEVIERGTLVVERNRITGVGANVAIPRRGARDRRRRRDDRAPADRRARARSRRLRAASSRSATGRATPTSRSE